MPRQQHVGKAAHVAMQFFIRDVFTLRGIVAFPDDGRFVAAFGKMAVRAVRRQFSVPSSYHLMETLPGAKEVFFTF